MGWGVVDDGFYSHPKVVDLILNPNVDGVRALGVWPFALSWACRHTKDKPADEQGVIPARMIQSWDRLLGRVPEAAEALADARLWDRLPHGAYRIHDFREWAQLEKREKAQADGRRGAAKRWPNGHHGDTLFGDPTSDHNGVPIRGADGDPNATPNTPSPPLPPPINTRAAHAAFDEFWKTYPRRIGKDAARRRWAKVITKTDPARVIAGAKVYAELCERKRTETKYIAHPATWLNAGRWQDEHNDDDDEYGVPPWDRGGK